MTNSPIKVRDHKKPFQNRAHLRVCVDCGFKDSSPVPPVMCPNCHNQKDSPLATGAVRMSRHERRRRDKLAKLAERKNKKTAALQMKRVNAQIARENPSGKYEAS